ncbi:MAG: hypothetical protein JJT89_06585 [Nitriliruptoraceae bacterium]|nr:hypothetical protein [Nitriliruptoraceae bacterium]
MASVTRTHRPSARVHAKALRILAAGRAEVIDRQPHRDAVRIEGDHGTYVVVREGPQVTCPCPAIRPCSHALAALIATGRRRP